MLLLAPGRERLELTHACGTKHLSQIVRDLEGLNAVEDCPRPIAFRRRDLCEPSRLHPSFSDETRDPHLIRARPSTPRLARRKEQGSALVVERLVETVDPAVAERFRDGVVVTESCLPSRSLVCDEPDALDVVVVVVQPPTPLSRCLWVDARVVRSAQRGVTCSAFSLLRRGSIAFS